MTATRPTTLHAAETRLGSGGLWAFGGHAVTIGATFGLNVVLARVLTADELGAYFLALSLVTVVALLARAGLPTAIVRLLSEARARNELARAQRVTTSIVRLGFLTAIAAAVLVAAGLGPLVAEELFASPLLASVMVAVGIWTAAETLRFILSEAFRGRHDIVRATALGDAYRSLCSLVMICIAALWLSDVSLRTVANLSALASVVTAATALVFVMRHVGNILTGPMAPARAILAISLPLMMSQVTRLLIEQADLWIVGAFFRTDVVAIYGAALRLALLLFAPLFIVNAVIAPRIAALHVRGEMSRLEQLLRRSAAIASVPALAGLALYSVFGSEVLALVFGPLFKDGACQAR